MNILDAIITNPNDELYDLQGKYGVKISRSDSSSSVYIFKTNKGFRVRVGHYIPENMSHIHNFKKNIISNNPSRDLVEKVIKQYLNKF